MCQRLPLSVPKPVCSLSASITGRICPNILPHPLYPCRMSSIQRFQCFQECKLTSPSITSVHRDGSFKYHRNSPKWPSQGHLTSPLWHLVLDIQSVKTLAASLRFPIYCILSKYHWKDESSFILIKAPTTWPSSVSRSDHILGSQTLSYLICPET